MSGIERFLNRNLNAGPLKSWKANIKAQKLKASGKAAGIKTNNPKKCCGKSQIPTETRKMWVNANTNHSTTQHL